MDKRSSEKLSAVRRITAAWTASSGGAFHLFFGREYPDKAVFRRPFAFAVAAMLKVGKDGRIGMVMEKDQVGWLVEWEVGRFYHLPTYLHILHTCYLLPTGSGFFPSRCLRSEKLQWRT